MVLILLREVKHGRLKLGEAAEMARTGASAVAYGLEAVDVSPEVFGMALELYGLGHRDIFDDILYATAVVNEMYFLTLDGELIRFIEEEGASRYSLNSK